MRRSRTGSTDSGSAAASDALGCSGFGFGIGWLGLGSLTRVSFPEIVRQQAQGLEHERGGQQT